MSEAEERTTTRESDCFTIWPAALACSFPVLLIIIWAGPFGLSFVGAPVLFVAWALAALLTVVMAIFSAQARQWRRAFSLSILPLATLVAVFNAGTAWLIAIETGERIRFELMRGSYVAELSKLQSTGEPRFAFWPWGGFVIGHGVVYDESDEILSPAPSAAWKNRVADTEVGMCGAWGTPLGGHFYLVRTGC